MKVRQHIVIGIEAAPRRSLDKARRLEYGCPLRVAEVPAGLHEKAEGITRHPIYRISWERPRRFLGAWRLPGIGRHAGTYVKLDAERLRLPPEAARGFWEAAAAPHIEETAVFLDTRLGGARIELVLAARAHDRWSALHRWTDTWRHTGLSRHEISSF